ncbi:amino acid ABC transporter permease [Hydrogenophaga taeniospiralis CCUG 15921]|uniref:Amino acid ABC transporter permease n=1 Tax=Hydrogenophaga taeniospiralis CCUG 15921 TaxID=1281780 RepID=A0A9X4SGG4_9BURK|nr:amino acid ABC transporter permease [Hydrogenophaga taeniospiralis]MDG5976981.1 amino acid ABC transporter permease [Hydrogenophaga taeniospiralis CCUG 15921]
MQQIYQPIDARPMPGLSTGVLAWLKTNLFSSTSNSIKTLIVAALALWAIYGAAGIGIAHAVFSADLEACNSMRGIGACWGVIAEKGRLIVMGRYPDTEHWRPVIATALMLGVVGISCMPRFWNRWLGPIWLAMLVVYFVLMRGGVLGLTRVDNDQWGGLPLTVMLTVVSMTMAFPLSIFVALGRRSNMPAIKTLCTLYVELIRGVPLITVLFMASFMLPLFMPDGVQIDVLIRVLVAITLFSAAYMAEVVRGGLQALPKGQTEAAATLGLTYWQAQRKIVLPQALSMVVPSLMNTFIGMFKDTSLVTIVSLYELAGAVELALNADADWRPFKLEAYFFIALIYFVFCFAMSRYSLWVEKRTAVSKVR